MSSKIAGVPEGWELVRIDKAKQHEFYLDGCGEPRVCRWDNETAMGCSIVRKIEPPKPLIIEAGKWYRLRGGDIVGPIKRCDYSRFIWTDGSLMWTSKGSYDCSGYDSEADIVDEALSPEPPKPVYVPWTYETCPVGTVIRRKNDKFRAMIVSATVEGVSLPVAYRDYHELLDEYETIDGTPCGTVVEE